METVRHPTRFRWTRAANRDSFSLVIIHLINTGRELMLGWRVNSHHPWISRQLYQRGYQVARQVAVDDSPEAILGAVRESLATADLILTTGGLGPTSDDRTRDLVAGLAGRPLREDPAVAERIRSYFTARRRDCPARVLVQAQVPEGAEVLLNAHGTAPGLVLEIARPKPASPAWLVMLPGPPRELQPMFLDQVLPLLQTRFPLPTPFACRILRSTGLGESWVEEKVGPALAPLTKAGLDVGYCARPGEVDIQLLVRGEHPAQTVAQAEALVRAEIGETIFGMEEELLESVVVDLLRQRRQTLAVAESCTGGIMAHRLTNVPGASEVFLAGLVTYSNAAKESFLEVSPAILEAHGAVSAAVAEAMALGARTRTGADYALAATGIAGPSGGSPEKPLGTVFIGLATAQSVQTKAFLNPFNRETFKYVTSQQALEWLRQTILQS